MKKIMFLVGLLVTALSTTSMAAPAVTFSSNAEQASEILVVFADDAASLDGRLGELNLQSEGRISQLISLNDFDASLNSVLHLQMVAGVEELLIVGTASTDPLSAAQLQDIGGTIAKNLNSTTRQITATVFVDNLETLVTPVAAHIALGYHLRDYAFDVYKAKKRADSSSITLVTSDADNASAAYANDLRYVAEGVHLARDLAWEPGKTIYPAEFVKRVTQKLKGVKNIKIKVLDLEDMQKLNMGALMGVGQGSIHEPKLLVVEYSGATKNEAPIALAGKGITFDTGGISLKPNDGMWGMKSDLSGAAAVAGTMFAVASRGESVNLIGLMPLAENMPAEDAIRPGDVLDTMKGTTIEIISTDAEGRLILSDAVYYAQQEYAPKLLLNIATLTGSAARALSDEYAALITRDFDTSMKMMEIGKRAGEHVWPLPLHPNHFEQIESDIADIKNSGAGNPGASIGAAVIGTFVDEDQPWVHLDIAGVDWLTEDLPTVPKGAQGWGVRFMDQLVREMK